MPSTFTNNLGITLPADGELDGVWGDTVNDNMDILDRAINGSVALSLSGTTSTLTTSDGTLSNGQYKALILGGTPSGTHTITIAPNDAQKIYYVYNLSGQSVIFTQGSGTTVTIANGDSGVIYSDGGGGAANVVNLTDNFAMNSVNITGGTITGITDLAVADGGTGASSAANARTNLGLVIGTNVLAYDANLQTFLGVINFPAADGTVGQVLSTNGAGTLSFTTESSTADTVEVTTSTSASAFKIPFANTTVSTTGYYGLLQDSTATFTYNPSTNTVTAGTFAGNATSLTGLTTSVADLNFVSGVTSAVQTQINTKAPSASPTFTGQTAVAIGSAAAPGLIGSTVDTGIIISTVVAISTAGVERARFNNAGGLSFASSFGTSGQLLQSSGSAASPVWVTPPLSEGFVSTNQTITASGALTLAHSLGAQPKLVFCELVCITAEAGYAVSDVLMVSNNNANTSNNRFLSVIYDATNVVIRFTNTATCFAAGNATTGADTVLTNANWRLRVRAFT